MKKFSTTFASRRQMLGGLAAGALGSLAPARWLHAAATLRFRDDPFTLGVASGYPGLDSVVLWTRLAPAPLQPGGGMPNAVVPVDWEIATDEHLRDVVQRGTEYATPEWAHSVHAEPAGLEPGRHYWYRFTAGGARSTIGRTSTSPPGNAEVERLRVAVASCQQYEHGYYTAYRHLVDDAPDVVVHTGDYVYELSWGKPGVRRHGAPECYTLDDYRARYALYKSDAQLQAAHACCPWLVTWDDHEVDNDYAGDRSEENDDPAWFLERRAAAYRAWYEHLPLPRRAVPFGPYLRLHAARSFGPLLNVVLLDERQYRSRQACPSPGRGGSARVSECAELALPERTKLGASQEAWLAAGLTSSKARWNLLAQGTVMAYVDEQPGPGERYWTDGWNGYPAARARFLEAIEGSRVRNPVVLSGDIHAFSVANLNRVPVDPGSPIVATEFTTTSISSQPVPQNRLDERRTDSPAVLLLNGERRGYLRLDVSRARLQADLVTVDSVSAPDAGRSVLASFVVEDGRAGPQPA